jgi:hypothetical protein
MGPMPHPITPDVGQMAYVGAKPATPALGTYDMRSECETCRRPVLCRKWPLNPWEHTTAEDLGLLAGEASE